MRDDFAVFILSHGRANNVITAKTLERQGYTGRWYVVIDNEDDQEAEYRREYGDRVLVFDKAKVARTFDTMDTDKERRTVVYARNACFELARQVGVRYFCEMDDDYKVIEQRTEKDGKLVSCGTKNCDYIFEAYLDWLVEAGALTVAMAQGGDFIGGAKGKSYRQRVLRKAMNTFFCDTEKPFSFLGRINEDVNTYTVLGSRGEKIFTACDASITQMQTQRNAGGMSDVYNDAGTYLKSFYTVMAMPSAVKIKEMGTKHRRIHHEVTWENCVPCILNERHKKRWADGEAEERNRSETV